MGKREFEKYSVLAEVCALHSVLSFLDVFGIQQQLFSLQVMNNSCFSLCSISKSWLMNSSSMSSQTSEWGGVEEAGGLLQSFIKAQRRLEKVFRLWHPHQPTTHHKWPWGRQQPVQLEPPLQSQPWPREPMWPSQGQSSSCPPQGQSLGGAGTPFCCWQSFVCGSPTGRNYFCCFFNFAFSVYTSHKSYHSVATSALQHYIGCELKCLDPSLHFTGSRAGLGGEASQFDTVQRPGHQPVAGGDPGWVNEGYSRSGLCCQAD